MAAGQSVDPGRWQTEFDGLMARVAPRFARVESRRLARDAVAGLMSGLAVKVKFATKPALATEMITRALDAGVTAHWLAGDALGWQRDPPGAPSPRVPHTPTART